LEKIEAQKRRDVAASKARLPSRVLEGLLGDIASPRSLKAALTKSRGPHVIAEVKRASPSKGILKPDQKPFEWDPLHIARRYAASGAAALSVLTDVRYFWGQPELIEAAKAEVTIPVLRKDFIIDPWQVLESRWLGADALLLMVRSHTPESLSTCYRLARDLGMDVLVEVHEAAELDLALGLDEAIIGVNHRNLSTLELDPNRALDLKPQIPEDRVAVAESGINSRADLERLASGGYNAFLIGGHLSASPDPGLALTTLLGAADAH